MLFAAHKISYETSRFYVEGRERGVEKFRFYCYGKEKGGICL